MYGVDDFIDNNEVQYDETLKYYMDDEQDVEHETDDKISDIEGEIMYSDIDDSND